MEGLSQEFECLKKKLMRLKEISAMFGEEDDFQRKINSFLQVRLLLLMVVMMTLLVVIMMMMMIGVIIIIVVVGMMMIVMVAMMLVTFLCNILKLINKVYEIYEEF